MDDVISAAVSARGAADRVAAWARLENAAAARRLAASADLLAAAFAASGSAEREQWCLDNWDAMSAEMGAAQGVSLGVASHQLLLATALRDRLPRVAEAFAAGFVSLRTINAIVFRTALVKDPVAREKIDSEIAAAVTDWATLSVAKVDAAIDYWVDRYDPMAVRRVEQSARDRHVDVHVDDSTGVAYVEAKLLGHDGEALDARLDAWAAAVCDADPRTHEQRRSDALAAFGHGADRLVCGCGTPDCAAAGTAPSAVVVHVIAEEASLTDSTHAALDGAPASPPDAKPLRQQTIDEALAPDCPTGTALTNPALILGGGLLPAPILAAKVAATAKIVPIRHPGDAPPEPRYIPSAVLAWFVRARDLTCRFPGCDRPAHRCDLDHTIAYPYGPTQASNLTCLCRKHHLLKTFWGWRPEQWPDGTVVWTSPRGRTYTTAPGSRLLFPTLCRPTAPVLVNPDDRTDMDQPGRALAMPRRDRTRTADRAARVDAEREHNRLLAEAEALAEAHAAKTNHARPTTPPYPLVTGRYNPADDPAPF